MQEEGNTSHIGEKNEKHSSGIAPSGSGGAVALGIVLFAGLMSYVAHYYVSEHSASIKFFAEAMFSFLTLIVVVYQVSIYKQQADFMKRQLEISRRTFELLERPSLGIASVQAVPTEDEKGHVIKAALTNTGHLPARAATVIVSGAIVPWDVPERDVEMELWPLTPPPNIIISKGSVAINANIVSFAYPTMTNEQIKEIEKGDAILYACVRADYGIDGITQPYFLEYYGRYSRHTGEFDVCDTHNDSN